MKMKRLYMLLYFVPFVMSLITSFLFYQARLMKNDCKRSELHSFTIRSEKSDNKTNEALNYSFATTTKRTPDYRNETDEEFMSRMEVRMKKRRELSKEVCNKLKLSSKNSNKKLWGLNTPVPKPWTFLSEKHKLIFCEIPKSGCSNWKKVLMVLNGLSNTTDTIKQGQAHAAKIPTAKLFPTQEEEKIYNESIKFMVVRDPIERIVSAYRDKIRKNKNLVVFQRFSFEIAKKYGNHCQDQTKYHEDGTRTVEACSKHEAELSCESSHEVIQIIDAMYGRQDNITCGSDPKWKGNECVSKNSHFITSQLCNGKQKCRVVASGHQFEQIMHCFFVSSYLKILYRCISTQNMNTFTLCEFHTSTIQCPHGGVIWIGSAFFGRTNKKTCSFRSVMLNLHCKADIATASVSSACNGKQACIVEATSEWIQEDPCPSTRKYLQVWYSCVETNIIGPVRKQNEEVEPKVSRRKATIPAIYKNPPYIPRVFDFYANFDEFVSYLLDPANTDVTHDIIDHGPLMARSTNVRHWQFYNTLCHPCDINYDVIAHMETIEEDARYLLKRIGAPTTLQYPKGYDKKGGSSTKNDNVMKLLSTLSKTKLEKLRKLYDVDYKLFGYENEWNQLQNQI